MPEKEESSASKPDFIAWFSEVNKGSIKTVGGKGANLGEMYNSGIPVPPGFVVTAQAYDYFMEKSKLKDKIKQLLDGIKYSDTKQLDDITKEVRELILKIEFPEEMREEILEAYEDLGSGHDAGDKSAQDLIGKSGNPIFVAVRSSATAEDLEDASFAGQQDSFLNVKGEDELIEHIKKCFASLFTSRATYYRSKKGFKHEETYLAVVVQKMVDSDKSGVMFSKDPLYKNDDTIIEAVFGLGEGIVSGKITPDKYIISPDKEITDKKIANKKIAITRNSGGEKIEVKLSEKKSNSQVLNNIEIKELSKLAEKLETHYKKPQDIEFAIESDEIFIVQTRAITTIQNRAERSDSTLNGVIILEGLAASPGVGIGKIKIVKSMSDLPKVNEGDILVTGMTNPDMVVTMQKAAAIVTDEGGLTAHAAIVSREMGIPCIVGTQEATTKLKEGEIITVDGSNGKVYKGKVGESTKKEIKEVTAETKTKVKVIVDLPSFAERASKTGLKAVGLTRMEGIIAESGKHPNYYLENKKMEDYEEVIFKGINKIAEYFEELWIRTSDIRTDEYSNLEGAPKTKEANPMLGMHGIRYGLKHKEILKAELNALKRVSEKNKKIGLLLPQVILVDEIKGVKKILEEINFKDAKVGVMVETPAAVQIIKALCDEGIDFISFGTNDLTQYMLAIDRGNEEVQNLYDETHPAILYQLEYVIRVAKRNNVETSICGQAGSKKSMVKFLVEKGIDSISVNADVAKEISDYISDLENGRATDEEDTKEEKTMPIKEESQPKETKVTEEKLKENKELPEKETTENKIEESPKKEAVENEPEEITEKETEIEESGKTEDKDSEEEKKEEVQKGTEEESKEFEEKLEESEESKPEESPREDSQEEKKKDNLDIF